MKILIRMKTRCRVADRDGRVNARPTCTMVGAQVDPGPIPRRAPPRPVPPAIDRAYSRCERMPARRSPGPVWVFAHPDSIVRYPRGGGHELEPGARGAGPAGGDEGRLTEAVLERRTLSRWNRSSSCMRRSARRRPSRRRRRTSMPAGFTGCSPGQRTECAGSGRSLRRDPPWSPLRTMFKRARPSPDPINAG
jgi:hypothetical protein